VANIVSVTEPTRTRSWWLATMDVREGHCVPSEGFCVLVDAVTIANGSSSRYMARDGPMRSPVLSERFGQPGGLTPCCRAST